MPESQPLLAPTEFGKDEQPKDRPFSGIYTEYKNRIPLCLSDYTDALTRKTLSATLFMFFATFASTVSLGELAKKQTNNLIGVNEYLTQQSACGMAHAIFGGQPLSVLRPTGPITVFIQQISTYAHEIGVDFYAWFAWVGIFTGTLMLISAVFNLSRHIRLLTRFLHDLYATFVCTIYIEDGLERLFRMFTSKSGSGHFFEALVQLILFIMVVSIALAFNSMISSKLFTPKVREFLTDYALFIAVVVTIGTSYTSSIDENLKEVNVTLERIQLPETYGPTCQCYSPANSTSGIVDCAADDQGECHPRPWFVGHRLFDVSGAAIVYAALISIPITALFFIDQNLSNLLTQTPSRGLRKGSYYHSGFLLVGIFNFVFPLFGMPFVTASLPHSPQLANALSTFDSNGKVKKVYENRVAPIFLFALQGLPLFFPSLLEVVPEGVISGTLTFVGLAGILSHNEFVERCYLCFCGSEQWPKDRNYSPVSPDKLRLFTLIQFGCWALFWTFKEAPLIGISFPLVIVAIVPFRLKILPKIFTQDEINHLDSEDRELVETEGLIN